MTNESDITPRDDFQYVRDAYADWFFNTGRENDRFQNIIANDVGGGEDLGDFVEAIATLHSFGPNPLAWNEHSIPDPMIDSYSWAVTTIHRTIFEALEHGGTMNTTEMSILHQIAQLLVKLDPDSAPTGGG